MFSSSIECNSNEKADIVFLIDGSGSVGSEGFTQTLEFLKVFTRMFKIGTHQTRFALVVFDSNVHIEFKLNTHTAAAFVESDISSTT